MTRILIVLFFISFIQLFSQSDSIRCKELAALAEKIMGPESMGNSIMTVPLFVEGRDSMLSILNNPPYPAEALADSIEGKVMVGFMVDTVGNTCCYRVVLGMGHGCDEAALNYLKGLNLKFTPGIYLPQVKDIRVPVQMVLPVHFRLKRTNL